MKKLFILVFALTTALSFNALAQSLATLDIENGVTATVGSAAYVPVYADFDAIPGTPPGAGSFSLYIDFDDTALTFTGIANSALTGVGSSEPIPGRILLSWTDLTNGSMLNGTKLLDLMFTATAAGGPYALDFYPDPPNMDAGSSTVSGTDAVLVTTTFTSGDVTFNAAVPLKNWALFVGLGLIIAFVIVRFRRLV